MAEAGEESGRDKGRQSVQPHGDCMDVTVLCKATCQAYAVPSFPVITACLRAVKLQWEGSEVDNAQSFDGYMHQCEPLDHTLPAVARIQHGCANAFVIDVSVYMYVYIY